MSTLAIMDAQMGARGICWHYNPLHRKKREGGGREFHHYILHANTTIWALFNLNFMALEGKLIKANFIKISNHLATIHAGDRYAVRTET